MQHSSAVCNPQLHILVPWSRALQGRLQVSNSSINMQALTEVQHAPEAKSALSDGDVQRILAHRRTYLRQQRAFDRACIGSNDPFDPTQVCSLKQKT